MEIKLKDRYHMYQRKLMKITILCGYPLNETDRGGVPNHLRGLVSAVSKMKSIELHIVTLGKRNQDKQQGSFTLHIIERGKIPLFSRIRHLFLLKGKILDIEPDIVHAYGTYPTYSLPALRVQGKYPVVLTQCGVIAKEFIFRKGIHYLSKKFIAKPIERYVLSRIPHIVILTPHIRSLVSKLTDSRIHIVPDGIEFEKVRGFQPHKSEKPDILFMSHLSKMKGVDILIKALPMVLNSVPALNVYIAGTGPQEDEFKSLVKELNLEVHVKFLGYVSDEEEKYSYYKACKIVVAPSRWDCQPYAVTEGAACGKPIIASDTSNPALLDDGKAGFTFQSENVIELADKIIKLLKDDKLREEMGEAALEKARECDWNRIAEKMVEIYKEVIADFHERKG